MKIAVLNFSGNVGKTTLTKHLLQPRLNDYEVISVETINDAGVVGTKIKGSDFAFLQDELLSKDDLIIDVGTSNVEETMRLMASYKGSHEDIDYFLLPVISDIKQQIDTCETIRALIKLGVKPSGIRVIYNRVKDAEDFGKQFEVIEQVLTATKVRQPTVGVIESPVYSDLHNWDKTMENILINGKNLQSSLKEIADPVEKARTQKLIRTYRLCKSAKPNLDDVFNDLHLK